MSTGLSTNVWDFVIGGVKLSRFEVPSEFTVGHDMKIAKHYVLDEKGAGTIKTHFQGAFPTVTEWKGTFTTANAIPRAQQLDTLFVKGQPVTWQYGPYKWKVRVENFHYTPKWWSEVDYEIHLIVVEDATIASTPAPLTIDVNTQQFFDYGNAAYGTLVAADPKLPSSITTPYAQATVALQAAYPLRSASIQTLLNISSLIGQLVSGLQAYATDKESTAVLEADLARLSAALQALQGFGLLNENVQQLIGTAPSNTIVVNTVTSVFELAATYYPNVDVTTAAQAIMTANALNDIIIDGGTAIALPQVFS